MVTQIFLTYLVVFLSVVFADVNFLDNKLERHEYIGPILGVCALGTFIITPLWLLYLIWSVL